MFLVNNFILEGGQKKVLLSACTNVLPDLCFYPETFEQKKFRPWSSTSLSDLTGSGFVFQLALFVTNQSESLQTIPTCEYQAVPATLMYLKIFSTIGNNSGNGDPVSF